MFHVCYNCFILFYFFLFYVCFHVFYFNVTSLYFMYLFIYCSAKDNSENEVSHRVKIKLSIDRSTDNTHAIGNFSYTSCSVLAVSRALQCSVD